MKKKLFGQVVFFSKNNKLNDGVILDNGIIKICKDKLRKHVLDTEKMPLHAEYYYENACAAIAAIKNFVNIENVNI